MYILNVMTNGTVNVSINSVSAEVEINTGQLACGQLISCWASRICFALTQLASRILKPYF